MIFDMICDLGHWFICDLDLWFDLWFAHHWYIVTSCIWFATYDGLYLLFIDQCRL